MTCETRVAAALAWAAGLAGVMGVMGLAAPAAGQPVVVECQWKLVRTVPVPGPWSVAYNPVDGAVYVGARSSGADGLYRVDPDGTVTRVVAADRPGGIGVDPVDGDMFIAEDYGGNIYRVVLGAGVRETWVSGFGGGDDDPAGLVVVPPGYTGSVVAPGAAISGDRGANGGSDEVWMWSPDVAEGEVRLHADNGTLVDPVDVAVSEDRVVVVDDRGSPGALWEVVDSAGTLVQIATSVGIDNPRAAVFEPGTGDLLVVSHGLPGRVLRVRMGEQAGDVTEVIRGFGTLGWASVDMHPNGGVLWVVDYDEGALYEFARVGLCRADFNGDCLVNTLDMLAFLNAWAAGEERADWNEDGTVNTLDVLGYLNAWAAGC
ncbi:MAG: hypothetical protein IT431_13970 [Phycisphaerales bacterium]|nr:hypothetical protein [Phycisphaerales bacterium]